MLNPLCIWSKNQFQNPNPYTFNEPQKTVEEKHTLSPRNRERAMAARTLIVTRKVWVSNGLSKLVNKKMGWRRRLVGCTEEEEAQEEYNKGNCGLVGKRWKGIGWRGKWSRQVDEEREESGQREQWGSEAIWCPLPPRIHNPRDCASQPLPFFQGK